MYCDICGIEINDDDLVRKTPKSLIADREVPSWVKMLMVDQRYKNISHVPNTDFACDLCSNCALMLGTAIHHRQTELLQFLKKPE